MKAFDPVSSFGPETAAQYDGFVRGDEGAASAFLAQLARGGRALEFAIGTGRIALVLAAQGIQVDGIELSAAMIEGLRARPGGDRIGVTVGDMSRVTTGERYGLVYLVFNTLFNLLTAEDQIRCFENAARHLNAEGHFVVETALPHAWIAPGRADYVHAEAVDLDTVVLDVARYDPVTQLLEENHLRLTTRGITMTPIVCRLITPGEMDLMARIAGLRLVERFANWQRAPFDLHSQAHVSVYGWADSGTPAVDAPPNRCQGNNDLKAQPSSLCGCSKSCSM
jgi:SAM-dependent methyltransferase